LDATATLATLLIEPICTLKTFTPGGITSGLGTVARPTCVCCQCVSRSGLSQAVMGSFSFRFHALVVVLTYPRSLGRSQRLKQRPTLLLFTTTTPTLVHSHLLQTPVPTHSTCCQHLPLWHHPLRCSCLRRLPPPVVVPGTKASSSSPASSAPATRCCTDTSPVTFTCCSQVPAALT
jgi:hypothetical protein